MTYSTRRLLLLAALAILMSHTGAAQTTNFETLYSFQGTLDGGQPMGGVVIGKDGALYGTTYFGGASGDGTVFELIPAKSAPWKINVLHDFSAPAVQTARQL